MRIIILLLTLFLTATTAQATPPQTVGVSETLMGVNGTHLFVLRRLDDNMGHYLPTQTDVVLIARNRKTNLDDQIWPVMRMLDHGQDFKDDGFAEQVKILPLKPRVNPFDILLWRKARPLVAAMGTRAKDMAITKYRANATLTLTSDSGRYRLDDSVMANLLPRSLNTTRAAIPAYFIEGENRGGSDSLLDVEIDPAEECYYNDYTSFFETVDGQYKDFVIAYVTCESDYAMARLSMFLLVPKVK